MQCIWSSRASFHTNAIYSPLRSSGTKLNGSLRNFSLLSRNSASTLLRPGHASLRTVAYPLTCPNHSPSDRAHLTRLPLPRDENYIPGQPKQHSFGSSTPLSKKCSPPRLGIQLRLMQHLAPASPQLPLAKPNPKAASASFSRRPPELSRAAATAIRLAFARSARWDAFHVWHSLRWSMHRYSNPPPTTPFQKPTSKFQPIDFHQAVPPKLGGHCLLHSLIRAGERRLAGKLAEQMLADGIRIHSRTLDTILRVLHPPTPPGIMTPQKLSVPPTLSHCKAKHPDVQCAITLLHGAHNHRWQRTHAMYEKTISICLLQAEVLIASLLLALLLQDYQFHTSSRTRTVTESSSKCLDATPSPSPVKLANGTLGSWSQSLTHSIVHAIRPHLERGPQDPLFQESSEALAVLAGTVDSRSLPLYRIGPLLKLLYEYPKCNTYVWHTGDDITPRRIPARNYFHGVLTRLIDFLPVEPIDCLPTEPWRRAYHGGRRGLDITVYNTLIHYSLFEQRSPLMAQRVLDSMLIARTPPLEPSKETYLIAIRGCTLLRRNDIARRVLAAATGTKELSQGSIRVVANSDVPEENPQSFSGDTCTFRELIRRVGIGDLTVPPATIPSPMDTRLLVAYALHLSKTGRARRIHSLLYQLIPEFDTSAVKVATGQAQFEDNLKERRNTNRQAQIVRAMQLGPAVLSALIVGLRCAGSTGLAERLWEIIKMAEEASWTTADPWVISVHTYTTMMQVYKAEARRIAYIPTVSEAHPPPLKSKDHARGFGRMTSLPPSSRDVILTNSGRRWVVAREMGLDVYRRMMLTEDRMKRALEQATVDNASNVEALRARLHEVPQPDARFFNTAIRLVGRQDGMRRRRQHSRLSYWRTRLRQAWQRFEVLGVTPRRHDRQLLDIADDMAARGYEIPLGYQYLLAGHAKFSRLPPRRPQYPRVPVSTPSLPYKPSFPFSLRIPKTRGLPIRRGQRYSPAAQSRANR